MPVSIVRKDLIPLMQDKPDYLTQNHIRVFDPTHKEVPPSQINWYSDDAVHYTFREDPGDSNSLGRIRINFPSQYGVYMHDTPLKNLFGGDFRYDSSGCCRVQNVQDLVVWLLKDTKGWGPDHIQQAINSSDQINANLTKPVPLHWVYVTAWSASDGIVQFREDIYGRDGLGAAGHSADGEALDCDLKAAQARLGDEAPNQPRSFRLVDKFRDIGQQAGTVLRHRDADAIDAVAFVEHARARQLLGIIDQDVARRREGFGFADAQRSECIVRQIEADERGMLGHARERHGRGVIAHHGNANSGAVDIGKMAQGRAGRHQKAVIELEHRRREIDFGGAGRLDA